MQGISGVIVPAVTPKIDGSVDRASLGKIIAFLAGSKIDAVFILGTTGEFQFLTMEQKKEAMEASLVDKRMPVMVGVSDEELPDSLELVEWAEDHGADAVVLAPLYVRGDPGSVIKSVMEKSSIPVLLYNNPSIHGNRSIPLDLVAEFSSHEKIIGIKDSSGDWDYFQKLLGMSSGDFAVYQGTEDSIIRSLNSGARGIVPGSGNVAPGLFREAYDARSSITMREIVSLQREIRSLSENYISGIKKKLFLMKLISTDEMFG